MTSPRTGPLGVLTATGAMLYRHANGEVTEVPIGANGQILAVVAGVPAWVNQGDAVRESIAVDAVDAIFKQITIDLGGGAAAIANPTALGVGTRSVLSFAPDVRQGIPWQKHALQTYTTGKDIEAHVFWAADGADNGTARLAVALERVVAGDDLATDAFAAAVLQTTAAAPGVANQLVETVISISGASLDGVTPGDPLRFYLARVGDDGVEDTLTDNLILARVVLKEAA